MSEKLNALANECWEDFITFPDDDDDTYDDFFVHHESGDSFNVTKFARRVVDACMDSCKDQMTGHIDDHIEALIRNIIKEKIGV